MNFKRLISLFIAFTSVFGCGHYAFGETQHGEIQSHETQLKRTQISETKSGETQREDWNADTDVPIFIILGQSNADGSAFFNDSIDREMARWYDSEKNPHNMKIWYRSCRVENRDTNALGEAARWVVDGDVEDAAPGWLELWYRNENDRGRTSMTMIHGYGTYSKGNGTDCAAGRRGMEGAFGKSFQQSFPGSELYILKLGASGSYISSWANPADDTNWNYFLKNIFCPAINQLRAEGKRPRLAGVWWMQGCADASKTTEYYQECLQRLADRVQKDLGFRGGKLYVGYIPEKSVQFGRNVREAQDILAKEREDVEIVDTENFRLQYEKGFKGYLHFNQTGQNAIGEELVHRVATAGRDSWPVYNPDNSTCIPPPDISYP